MHLELLLNIYKKINRHVVLIDSNAEHIDKAKVMDLEAHEINVFSEDITDNIEFNNIGYLLALTGSEVVNSYAIKRFRNELGENGSFRLITADEMKNPENMPMEELFSKKDDFLNLEEVARDYPTVNEIELNSKAQYLKIIKDLNNEKYTIPLFIKDNTEELQIIASYTMQLKIDEGYKLVYLGKPMSFY